MRATLRRFKRIDEDENKEIEKSSEANFSAKQAKDVWAELSLEECQLREHFPSEYIYIYMLVLPNILLLTLYLAKSNSFLLRCFPF